MIRRLSRNFGIRFLLIAVFTWTSIDLFNHLTMKSIVPKTCSINIDRLGNQKRSMPNLNFEHNRVPDFIKIGNSSFYVYSAFLDSRSEKEPVLRVLGLIKHFEKTDAHFDSPSGMLFAR